LELQIMVQFLWLIIFLAGFATAGARNSLAQDIEPLQGINAKIAQIVSPNATPGEVQVATIPAVVQWDDNGGRYAFYQLCDVLSSWGPDIKPSGVPLSSRYRQYLLGIKARQGDVLADAQQRKLAEKAHEAESKLEDEQERLLSKWEKLVAAQRHVPEANRTAYTTFMLHQGARLASLQISALSAYSLWQPVAAKAAPSSAGFALSQVLNPASMVKVKTYSGASVNVLECSPNIDLTKALTDAQKRVEAKMAPDLVLAFGRKTGENRASWQSWGGGTGWGPFSLSANGSRSDVSVTSSNFKLVIEVPVVLRFSVTRPWLDFSIIQTYKDRAVLPDSELADLQPLFGEKGSFALVPLDFVVGYKPRVSVTMDSTAYSSAKSNYQGGGGFRAGPFSVGGSTAGGTSVEKWDDATSTVVISTGADSFVLLGVRNRVLP
jgi:hypothetical protein